MKRLVYLAAGFTIGYVVGSAAGRERYDVIVGKTKDLLGAARESELGTHLEDNASHLAEATTQAASDLADAATAKATSKVNDISDAVTRKDSPSKP